MSTLNSYPTLDLGVTQIPTYTCPALKSAVIIGSNIANKLDVTILVDIKFRRSGVDYYVLKQVMIPPQTAYVSSGDEQKMVFNAGDTLEMISNFANSADVMISVSEFPSAV